MPVQFILTLRGHPWDLYGLSKLYDGTNTDHMLVKSPKPNGEPTIDFKNRGQIDRFQKLGYDIFAPLTCDALIQAEGPPDVRKMIAISDEIIARINGIARLLDPEFFSVSFYGLAYRFGGGEGAAGPRDTTRNKANSSLGWHSTHASFADKAYEISKTEPAVQFLLDAFAMRATWVSMYLIYETIKDNVGGQKELENKNWVSAQELSDFRFAANRSRSLSEGMRHATTIQSLPIEPIQLFQAHAIIDRLAKEWIRSLTLQST